jgi:hypothetical protein
LDAEHPSLFKTSLSFEEASMRSLNILGKLPCAAVVVFGAATCAYAEAHSGVKPISVLAGDRLLVEVDGETLDCALVKDGDHVFLDDCSAGGTAGPSASILEELSSEEWQAAIRTTLLDAECKLSAFGAIADVIEQAALARGVETATVERHRDDLEDRAEEAIDTMLRDGSLTFRDGELALDQCK